jgi:hypothetical protein
MTDAVICTMLLINYRFIPMKIILLESIIESLAGLKDTVHSRFELSILHRVMSTFGMRIQNQLAPGRINRNAVGTSEQISTLLHSLGI